MRWRTVRRGVSVASAMLAVSALAVGPARADAGVGHRPAAITPESADAGAAAQEAYDALVATGGGWDVPAGIRTAMDAADFPTALQAMALATEVLASRDDALRKATDLGLTLPAGPEEAYEAAGAGGDTAGDLAAASAALDEQHLALATLFEIDGARVDAEEQLAALGIPTDLSAYLAPARAAFEAGELDDAYVLADEEATEIAAVLDTGEILAATVADAARDRGALERIGLLGSAVDRKVDDARDALAAGDRARAESLATDAQRMLDDAARDGATRSVAAAAVLVAAAAVALALRARTRRRSASAPGAPANR